MDWQNLIEIAVMAVFQGIAEFLPISSSGHLAVLAKLSGQSAESAVNISIVLHAGTLVSIVLFYFKSLLNLLNRQGIRTVMLIFVGSLPAGVAGIVIKLLKLDDLLALQMLVVGTGFLFTAMLLRNGLKSSTDDGIKLEEMTIKQALLIGIAQAIAICPGISRSGSTIASALKLGVKKADCARFSFFLAIPAIGGATLLQLISALKKSGTENIALFSTEVIIGFSISVVVGFVALKLLISMLNRGKLEYFSWYLWVIGIVVLSWGIIDLFI
ncbi:MAG: undecaprenyl-diphosphate phosphatase [Victivallaceae bacterium]|nr:undecaprenyl-diphosphate phosphatase [Victivallaceae bacterium]